MSMPSDGLRADVYPLHALDGIPANRHFLTWIMRFNDVLDGEKLHHSLSRLLEIGDWKKLGGRLKYKKDGKLEVHVPPSFTAEKPAVAFSSASLLDTSIEEHAVAGRFPKPTDGPSIQPLSDEFLQFGMRPDFPKTMKECVRQDVPQMSLHVTSFSDATIVGLMWPHTMMDAMGHQALLRAWSLVLAGRDDEVPPMLGAREDVLAEMDTLASEGEQEEFKLESKRLVGIGAAKLVSRFVWDKMRNPAPERRLMYVPKEFIARLQAKARSEAVEDAQGLGQDAFVSEGDVLTAWATRIMASTQMVPRPITVISLLNARFRIPQPKSTGVYAQNMTLLTYTFLSPQAAKGSVGSIALAHRRHLAEQATEQQVLRFVRSAHQDIKAGKNPRLMFGESDSVPVLFNNLIKADLLKAVDFAPAVVRQGEKAASRRNPPGSMTAYYNQALNKADKVANTFYMLGKDHGGNFWLMASLLPRTWTTLENELQNM